MLTDVTRNCIGAGSSPSSGEGVTHPGRIGAAQPILAARIRLKALLRHSIGDIVDAYSLIMMTLAAVLLLLVPAAQAIFFGSGGGGCGCPQPTCPPPQSCAPPPQPVCAPSCGSAAPPAPQYYPPSPPVYAAPPPPPSGYAQAGRKALLAHGVKTGSLAASGEGYLAETEGLRRVRRDTEAAFDPKCNSEALKDIILENIDSSTAVAKRQIQEAATERLGGRIDVICSTGTFSYIVNTELYCETEKSGTTCFAFRQSS